LHPERAKYQRHGVFGGEGEDSCTYIALPQGLKPEAYSGARMHTSRSATLPWYLAGGLTRLIRLIIYGR